MAEHTKGPWKAHYDEREDCWSVRTVAGDQGWMYTEVVERCPQDEIDGRNTPGADARLIASAPELLEALEAVLDMGNRDDPDVWGLVYAAIAKAKGEGQ